MTAWTARSLAEGGSAWREWLTPYTRGRALPRRIDLLRTAREWTDHVGKERVRVVLDPDLVPKLVGVRRLPGPDDLSADATDLARGATLPAVADSYFLDTPGKVEAFYLATLTRRPTDEERERLVAYVDRGGPSRNPMRDFLIGVVGAVIATVVGQVINVSLGLSH